jgi:asparagine synthase (glutamine-hydrolysing)
MSPLEPSAIAEVFYQPLNWQDLYGEAITLWEGSAGADPVDRTLEFFTNLYLPDDILAKVDRAAMMVSLEARAVFLDNDLVEFCRRLPNRFKFRRGQRKYLLKKALEGRLPPSILVRRKKGFGIPLSRWLRHMAPALPPWTPAGMRPEPVEAFWRAHCDGRRDHRLFLWCWLSLQHCLAPPPAMAQRGAA